MARIAQPLAPTTKPYFVNSYRPDHPANGWYWVPAIGGGPQYLGRNHIEAEMKLLGLREEAHAHAA
ncbi:MAG TPA: hypothetical protein VFR97_05010 [Capillimicrobium sp.]|nr:hypothetical protein [Capillimicrobium sp.]